MDQAISQERRILLVAGALLFTCGLVTGLFSSFMANPRMGLSAHLEGLMNGVVLIALGCAWQYLALERGWRRAAVGLLLYAAFVNWLTVTLAAIWNAGRLTPIAGPSPTASDWQENIVAFGLLSLSAAILGAFGIIVAGFWRAR